MGFLQALVPFSAVAAIVIAPGDDRTDTTPTDEAAEARRAANAELPEEDRIPEIGAPGGPPRELVGRELERWVRGREVFRREMDSRDGLGPRFNAASCGACHIGPALGGAGGLEFNVAVAGDSAQVDDDDEERRKDAISRYLRSRDDSKEAQEIMARLKRGRSKHSKNVDSLVANTVQTPSIFGLGALERVHEDEILGREDPHDRDGDGVRGIANRVPVEGVEFVGRFGWRADLPTMRDFVRAACGGELGLTVPDEVGFGQVNDGDLALDPEMTLADLDALVFYCKELAAPARKGNAADPDVIAGEKLFAQVGCATCHVPTLYGADGAIHPYTDMLLHAVAPTVPRRLDRRAEPALFRTPPLWGVADTAPYLHDGRAETLHAAIEAHEGEADGARERYLKLSPSERESVLAFLNDL